MARVPDLKPEEMTEEQNRVDALIGATRSGRAGGPFAIWLRDPALAEQPRSHFSTANSMRTSTATASDANDTHPRSCKSSGVEGPAESG